MLNRFGRALAEAVLKKGDYLLATAREPEQLRALIEHYPESAKAVRLDVTFPKTYKQPLMQRSPHLVELMCWSTMLAMDSLAHLKKSVMLIFANILKPTSLGHSV
jgi:hypothetical protein